MNSRRYIAVALVSAGLGTGIGFCSIRGGGNNEADYSGSVENYSAIKNYIESDEGIESFIGFIKEECERNPERMRHHIIEMARISLTSDYRDEAFNTLSLNERINLLDESLRKEARSSIKSVEDIANEFIEKFSETKIYEIYLGEKEEITKDARDKLSETEIVRKVKDLAENLRSNFRKRVLGEED